MKARLQHFLRYTPYLLLIFVLSIPINVNAKISEDLVLSQSSHQILLFDSGIESLVKRLQMIRRAQSKINVEYYIFRNDLSGKLIIEELIKKARQGVKVKILLDYHLNISLIDPFIAKELMKVNNIVIKYFNHRPIVDPKFQFRNHRKLLLIDDEEFMTGGRNIGNEYFDLDPEYNFLDRDIWAKGPMAKQVSRSFDQFWNSRYSSAVAYPSYPKQEEHETFAAYQLRISKWEQQKQQSLHFIYDIRWKKKIDDLEKSLSTLKQIGDQIHCKKLSFITDYPGLAKSSSSVLKNEFIRRFKEKIQLNNKDAVSIESPYFIRHEESKDILFDLLDSGTSVNILTNSLHITDALWVSSLFYDQLDSYLDKGLNAFVGTGVYPHYLNRSKIPQGQYSATWGIHSKSIVFDQQSAFVGTFNWDPRSFSLNMEMGVLCDQDSDFVNTLNKFTASRTSEGFGYQIITKEDIKDSYQRNTSLIKRLFFHMILYPSRLAIPLM